MKTLFKTKFGSHLYGTDTPASDRDYKGVFQSSIEDIVLRKDQDVFVTCTKEDKSSGVRNTSEDTDVEMKELRRFLKDCMQGQTYALDMLFAPENMWIETSPTWQFIVENRQKLLSKNVEPYIGYCRQQAGKYGLKGSRLGELKKIIAHLEEAPEKTLLEDCVPGYEWSEFVTVEELPVRKGSDQTSLFLNVLGKKFQYSTRKEECLKSLNRMDEAYGQRAVLAMKNEGVDWKAISHAYRCCYQLIELARTGEIKFPLLEATYIKGIKLGEHKYVDLQDELYGLMETAIKEVEKSQLPSSPNYAFWDEFILKTYIPCQN